MNAEDYLLLLSQKNSEKEENNEVVKTRTYRLLKGIITPSIDSGIAIESLINAFDLDNAGGNQLDIIGSIIGLKRVLPYNPSTGDRSMDDDEYRLSLKLQIAQNVWDGTFKSLAGIYSGILGSLMTLAYTDHQDMSVTISIYGDSNTRLTEIFNKSGLLLVPAGVDKEVSIIGETIEVVAHTDVGISGVEWLDTAVIES